MVPREANKKTEEIILVMMISLRTGAVVCLLRRLLTKLMRYVCSWGAITLASNISRCSHRSLAVVRTVVMTEVTNLRQNIMGKQLASTAGSKFDARGLEVAGFARAEEYVVCLVVSFTDEKLIATVIQAAYAQYFTEDRLLLVEQPGDKDFSAGVDRLDGPSAYGAIAGHTTKQDKQPDWLGFNHEDGRAPRSRHGECGTV